MRGLRGCIALAACVLLWAACGEGAGSAADLPDVPEEERYGGTAVIGGQGEIPTLNPLASSDYVADQVFRFALYTPLVRYDQELEPRPWLAESWSLGPDSTSVVFRLRDDVRWHDGEPVTAEDVAFTFRRAVHPDVPFPNRGWFARWDSVEVVDAHTVRFRFRYYSGFLYGWSRLPILPRHVLGDVPPEELAEASTRDLPPVGSGPFRFVELRAGDRWIFEAVEDFPEALGGRPYLDRLVYRVVPDPTTLLAELRGGGVDFYMRTQPSQVERVRSDTALRLRTFPFPTYHFIAWNARRPFFERPEVRRALTLAIDREELVEAVRYGLGTPAAGPVGDWHWAADPSLRPLPHDPDSARALLERAGWVDRDGDGVREKDGVRFAFELMTNENPVRRDLAVMVQAQLARVGIDATPRTREYASMVAAVTDPERPFDAFVLSWTQDLELDERDQWACDRIEGPFQFASYCNPELDAVMDSLPEAGDRETRRRLYRRYNRMLRADQPYAFLFFETRADAVRRELRGVEMDVRGELLSVADWWVHPRGRR